MIRSERILRLAAFCMCVFTACAGNGPLPDSGGGVATPSAASFDSIQQTIFNLHCLSAGCHNSSDQAGNLVLDAGRSYANLAGVRCFNQAVQNAGLLRVVPGDPDHSFLLIKLTLTGAGAEGSPMPLNQAALAPEDIDAVRNWILAGAPNSEAVTSPTPPTATATDTATLTPTATATVTPTPTLSPPPTVTRTGTLAATDTPTPTQPPTATFSPTATPSTTATPSVPPTPTFSVDSTFPQIQATIFNTTCINVGCHNAKDQAGSLVLEAGMAYANLVGAGAAPANDAARTAGMLRVDPGNPANSFLITKLTLPKVFDALFGSRMPSGAPTPLPAEQIDHIRAWILRGALANE